MLCLVCFRFGFFGFCFVGLCVFGFALWICILSFRFQACTDLPLQLFFVFSGLWGTLAFLVFAGFWPLRFFAFVGVCPLFAFVFAGFIGALDVFMGFGGHELVFGLLGWALGLLVRRHEFVFVAGIVDRLDAVGNFCANLVLTFIGALGQELVSNRDDRKRGCWCCANCIDSLPSRKGKLEVVGSGLRRNGEFFKVLYVVFAGSCKRIVLELLYGFLSQLDAGLTGFRALHGETRTYGKLLKITKNKNRKHAQKREFVLKFVSSVYY